MRCRIACRCSRRRDGGGNINFVDTRSLCAPIESLEVLIPILCLKGISTGDRGGADRTARRRMPAGSRPSGGLKEDLVRRTPTRWNKRVSVRRRYVYFWVDGIHVQAQLEEAARYAGDHRQGKKNLIGFHRRRARKRQSWKSSSSTSSGGGLRWDPSSGRQPRPRRWRNIRGGVAEEHVQRVGRTQDRQCL